MLKPCNFVSLATRNFSFAFIYSGTPGKEDSVLTLGSLGRPQAFSHAPQPCLPFVWGSQPMPDGMKMQHSCPKRRVENVFPSAFSLESSLFVFLLIPLFLSLSTLWSGPQITDLSLAKDALKSWGPFVYPFIHGHPSEHFLHVTSQGYKRA